MDIHNDNTVNFWGEQNKQFFFVQKIEKAFTFIPQSLIFE